MTKRKMGFSTCKGMKQTAQKISPLFFTKLIFKIKALDYLDFSFYQKGFPRKVWTFRLQEACGHSRWLQRKSLPTPLKKYWWQVWCGLVLSLVVAPYYLSESITPGLFFTKVIFSMKNFDFLEFSLYQEGLPRKVWTFWTEEACGHPRWLQRKPLLTPLKEYWW